VFVGSKPLRLAYRLAEPQRLFADIMRGLIFKNIYYYYYYQSPLYLIIYIL
jgi:hypothetical protein